MGYLQEFQKQIDKRDFHKFLQLWEEYCTNDTVDAKELAKLFKMIKGSDLAKPFGQLAETALPLWHCIDDKQAAYDVLRHIIDLQTTNSPVLAEAVDQALESAHGDDPEFKERLRLIGMRQKDQFQGAISNYDLLAHMKEGKCVFHRAGWGTGEVIEVSPIREQVTLEFEHVAGKKHLSFQNAFKTLKPLADDHFLARRFADPDSFEEDARNDPVGAVKLLLRDLGPKSASEIKEEMCEWVIPEKDWTKWWQTTRNKIKKDTMIASPKNVKGSFALREKALSHGERLQKAIHSSKEIDETIQTSYSFIRDHSNILKDAEMKKSLQEKMLALLSEPNLTKEEELQIYIFLETMLGHKSEGKSVKSCIQELAHPEKVVNAIDVIAFKKRALEAIRKHRDDWGPLFLSLLFTIEQNQLRDYLLKELNQGETQKDLLKNLEDLIHHPLKHPEVFFWYFQKTVKSDQGKIPYCNKEGQCRFFDGFLVLLHKLESLPRYRDLAKKMYMTLINKRYAVVRTVFDKASLDYVKEFLLLASKCHSFTDHDRKILRSLAAVIHPSLGSKKHKSERVEDNVIWTTQEGYLKTQERIQHIGTVEVVENAREVEAARALGDLRENAEYKFAVERRGQLQRELKRLSEQLNKARILTSQDIATNEVSVGTIVDVEDSKGNTTTYTLLGPWDADPDANILSFQSKMAEAMIGTKKGDSFTFRDETYKIVDFKKFLEK